MAKKIEEGRVIFPSSASGSPMLKRFKSEAKSLHMPISTWGEYKTDASSTAFITAMNTSGTKEIKDLFGDKVFTFPKPTRVIQSLAEQAGLNDSDIVLDFFSGSCSTAHAIMNESIQKNIKPKFIMVQLPEPCADDTPAFKMGFSNIADIGKERIRRAASKIASETTDIELLDLGFRVYKLGKSHFDQWQSEVEPGNIAQLQANLELHSSHIAEDVEQEALLYELLLKAGFELTESIEQQTFGNQSVFSIAEGALLICLEDGIEPETVEAMVKAEPAEIIVKDSAFAGNDPLKVNVVQTVKAYNQNSETDIVFKVV